MRRIHFRIQFHKNQKTLHITEQKFISIGMVRKGFQDLKRKNTKHPMRLKEVHRVLCLQAEGAFWGPLCFYLRLISSRALLRSSAASMRLMVSSTGVPSRMMPEAVRLAQAWASSGCRAASSWI